MTLEEYTRGEIMLMGDRVFISGLGYYTKERTCKPHGEWERTSQLQECRRVLCDCGHELGMDVRRGFPIKIVDLCELPNYCPNCGRKVVD